MCKISIKLFSVSTHTRPAPPNPCVEGFTWPFVSQATAATASGFAMRGKGFIAGALEMQPAGGHG